MVTISWVCLCYCYVSARLLCTLFNWLDSYSAFSNSVFVLFSLILEWLRGMLHRCLPQSITNHTLLVGHMPYVIISQSMQLGLLPVPGSKNRDGHTIMPLGHLPYSILPILLGHNFERKMVVFFHGRSGRNQASLFFLSCILPIFLSYGWNLRILVNKKLTYLFL